MLVKTYHNDDVKYFEVPRSKLTYGILHGRILAMYRLCEQMEHVRLKYKNMDGRLITITREELARILKDDLADDHGVLKVVVFRLDTVRDMDDHLNLTISSNSNPFIDVVAPSAEGYTNTDILPEIISNTKISSSTSGMMEILRDISYYVSTNGMTPINQWVSLDKKLITPSTPLSSITTNGEKALTPSNYQRNRYMDHREDKDITWE